MTSLINEASNYKLELLFKFENYDLYNLNDRVVRLRSNLNMKVIQ